MIFGTGCKSYGIACCVALRSSFRSLCGMLQNGNNEDHGSLSSFSAALHTCMAKLDIHRRLQAMPQRTKAGARKNIGTNHKNLPAFIHFKEW